MKSWGSVWWYPSNMSFFWEVLPHEKCRKTYTSRYWLECELWLSIALKELCVLLDTLNGQYAGNLWPICRVSPRVYSFPELQAQQFTFFGSSDIVVCAGFFFFLCIVPLFEPYLLRYVNLVSLVFQSFSHCGFRFGVSSVRPICFFLKNLQPVVAFELVLTVNQNYTELETRSALVAFRFGF